MGVRFSVRLLFNVALATAALVSCSMAVFDTADAATAKKGVWALTNEVESNNPRYPEYLTQFNKKPKRFIYDGIYGRVDPPYGDRELYFRKLRWSSWGGATARAEGEFTRYRARKKAVTIEFSRPIRCGGWRMYTHLRLVDWAGKEFTEVEPDYDTDWEAWKEWDELREKHRAENEGLHDRPVRFYRRCEIEAPSDFIRRGSGVKPRTFAPLPPHTVVFKIGVWKGWGGKRAYARRVYRDVLCGIVGCVVSESRATLTVSDIRFCKGTLMYTRITARWNGKRKQYRVRGKWCRPGYPVS